MSDVPPPEGQNPQQPGQQPPPQQPQQPPAGQQPPPQQPGQQPPPQQQPAGQGGDGLDPKVGGLLAYITWIGGLIVFLTQKHPEVRFHGAQSILFNIALIIVYIVLFVLQILMSMIAGPLGLLVWLLSLAVWIGSFVLWIFLVMKGYNLQHWKLPVIGDMAEKWASN